MIIQSFAGGIAFTVMLDKNIKKSPAIAGLILNLIFPLIALADIMKEAIWLSGVS